MKNNVNLIVDSCHDVGLWDSTRASSAFHYLYHDGTSWDERYPYIMESNHIFHYMNNSLFW